MSQQSSVAKLNEIGRIAIDGKTLRSSYDREAKQKPLTVVSA